MAVAFKYAPPQPSVLSRIIDRTRARKNGRGWRGRCPVPGHHHGDRKPSLSIGINDDGRILLHCQAQLGHSFEQICAALDVTPQQLSGESGPVRLRETEVYDYVDESGELQYQVVRYDPKDFRIRRPAPKGGYLPGLGKVKRIPYHLPEILATDSVLVCEGEKDANAATKLGFAATSSTMWQASWSEIFAGKRVAILQDRDEAGIRIAQSVAASLHAAASSIKIIDLPGAHDFSDWIDGGGTRNVLECYIESIQEWTPPPEPTDDAKEISYKPKFVQWHEDDHQADEQVRQMTGTQSNMTRALMLACYSHSARPYLPDDDSKLWLLAGADSLDHWLENREDVLAKFEPFETDRGRFLRNKRVLREWEIIRDKSERARLSIAARWNPNRKKHKNRAAKQKTYRERKKAKIKVQTKP